jgi:hypothetical protein
MSVKTTVTLDDDVVERAKRFSQERGISFRQALNDLVRTGLRAESAGKARPAFKIQAKHMGLRPGLNCDNIEALLEISEGELHR